MLFLAHGGSSTKRKLYRRIRHRLSDQPEFDRIRYEPSSIRPRKVVADVDPHVFVDSSYPASTAQIEIEFDLRSDQDHYWIVWIDPGNGFSCGWHQDSTHDELGPCHWQVDYRENGRTDREAATPIRGHALTIFEDRMDEFPKKLQELVVS